MRGSAKPCGHRSFRPRSCLAGTIREMIRAPYLVAAFALALGACATPRSLPTPAPTPTQPGLAYARISEEVNAGGPNVTPLEVLEDSRCPANVNCVWAGQVRLSVKIVTGRGSEIRELTSGKPVPVADGTLVLADVLPHRVTTGAVRSPDYRFAFRFDGGY
jgi:hypothetical protein